jgi:hypothetical protein
MAQVSSPKRAQPAAAERVRSHGLHVSNIMPAPTRLTKEALQTLFARAAARRAERGAFLETLRMILRTGLIDEAGDLLRLERRLKPRHT